MYIGVDTEEAYDAEDHDVAADEHDNTNKDVFLQLIMNYDDVVGCEGVAATENNHNDIDAVIQH